jgi:sugar lactone lactonase YvrE
MPKLNVFACPSCGASLSVDEGAATTKCQFCGNTVIVPEEIRGRGQREQPGYSAGAMGGLAQGAPLKELGNLVRAGDKAAAARLYRELFASSQAEADSAVERLSLGQGVQVVYMGMPTTLVVDRSPAAAAGGPQFLVGGQPVQFGQAPQPPPPVYPMASGPVQPVQPVIISGNPGRSLGCVVWIILLTTGLGILITLLATTGAMLPLIAMFGDGGLPFGLGDVLTNVPSVSTSVPRATAAPTFTPQPAFASSVLTFGSEGDGGGAFHDPRHIGVDAQGTIYVGEWEEHRVQVFDAEGNFTGEWSAGEDDAILTSMAVLPDGTVYCVAGSQLYAYDGATGELVDQLRYDDERGFDSVSAAADGSLLIAWSSAGVDTILRYRDGQFDLRLPNAVSGVTEQPELDIKMAGDSEGEIYALGSFNDAVLHFSPDGEFQNMIGGEGDEPGQFTAPGAIAVDLLGRVYVTDFKGIQVFDGDGEYLGVFDVPDTGFVHGLAFDQDGALFAVSNKNVVTKFQVNE